MHNGGLELLILTCVILYDSRAGRAWDPRMDQWEEELFKSERKLLASRQKSSRPVLLTSADHCPIILPENKGVGESAVIYTACLLNGEQHLMVPAHLRGCPLF